MKRLRASPLAMIILKDVELLEHDADSQYKFNRVAALFWLCNMPLVVVLSVAFPKIWLQISVMYLIQASLWALVATHFGAMSAALAAVKTTSTVQEVSDDVEEIHDVTDGLQPEILYSVSEPV